MSRGTMDLWIPTRVCSGNMTNRGKLIFEEGGLFCFSAHVGSRGSPEQVHSGVTVPERTGGEGWRRAVPCPKQVVGGVDLSVEVRHPSDLVSGCPSEGRL